MGRHPNGSCASRRVTLSRTTPSAPHRRQNASSVTRHDTALQHRRPGRHILAHDHQPQIAQTGERRHVRRAEGSVVHVEVFRDERVGAFILGRPRRLSRERRAHPRYTLIREEPAMRQKVPDWMSQPRPPLFESFPLLIVQGIFSR